MVASIIKTVQIKVLANVDSDPTVATADLERWLYIETYLVIITTSIPCLRSLLRMRKVNSASTYPRNTHRSGLATAGKENFSLRSRNGQVSMTQAQGRGLVAKNRSCSEDDILRNNDTGGNEFEDWKYPDHSVDENLDDSV